MDATTFSGIYHLANECPPYPAVYNARAIVEMLTGQKIPECQLDENWKMNTTLEVSNTPQESLLGENYPDPFNEVTFIPLTVPDGSTGKIEVTDITDRVLFSKSLDAGKQVIKLNTGTWEQGMYFYSLELDNLLIDSKKMVLVR
jgi:hypothetical protein